MYNLLIVDDEAIAVRAIERGIDWSDLPIGRIFTAGDYDDAVSMLQNHPIHILITDIEMPGQNGIRLLEYIDRHFPRIRTVVTTGHSHFEYIQKALQYRTLDYMLKPLDFMQLKSIVERAIQQWNEERHIESLQHIYEESRQQWQRSLPILEERFWQDVLNHRLRLTPENIRSTIETYRIGIQPDQHIAPILISIEHWEKPLSESEEEVLEYALRKASEELILHGLTGRAVQDRNGTNVLLVTLPENPDPLLTERLAERCHTFVRTCSQLFYCSCSCYIGESCAIEQTPYVFRRLLREERNNVTEMRTVRLAAASQPLRTAVDIELPSFPEWQTMLETGRKEEFDHAHGEWFNMLAESSSATPATLRAFCIGFMNIVFQVTSSQGLALSELSIFSDQDDLYAHCRSVQSLSLWSIQLAEELMARCRGLGRQPHRSAAIDKTIAFLNENLEHELSLKATASLVHLNPAYLSRLFKKEMGISISEYMIQARIRQAQEMLRSPDVTISSIAASVGYSHFSHFAKMFKRIVGMTPQEYRKQYLHR